MSRYRAAKGAQAETEPGSRGRVLRNRIGIVRKRDMDRAAYEALIAAQERYLARITEETRLRTTGALQAGLPLPQYRFTGRGGRPERERYLSSVVRGYYRDYELLTAFFRDALERGLRAGT